MQSVFLLLGFSAFALAQNIAPPLNLSELVQEALERNPEILAAQKRYEAALQRPAQQRALPDPTFSFGYNSNGTPLPGGGLGKDPTSNIGWMVAQEIPYPGKRGLRSSVAVQEAAAEAQQYRATQLSVVSRLKQAYHRLHHTYEVASLLDRSRDLLRSLLRITEARYSVGKAAQADVFRAQTQITLLETRLAQLQRERRTREAEINTLLARPLTAPLGEPGSLHPPALPMTFEELMARARERAPALLRDQKMIERADTSLNLVRKDYYPDVTINGGYFYQGSMPPMYTLRADVRLPLRLSRTRAEITGQAESASAARHAYDATGQTLQFRVKDEYLTAETALKLIAIYAETAIPQARLTVQSSLSAYETGGGDFLSVLTNQTAAIEYEMSFHEEMQNFFLAMARLEEMTGVSLMEP